MYGFHPYTPLQAQYLSFIHFYTKLNGRPPAEADMQFSFKTTPPYPLSSDSVPEEIRHDRQIRHRLGDPPP